MIWKHILPSITMATCALSLPAHEAFTINDGWTFTFGTDTTSTNVHLPHCWNEDAYATRDYRRGTGVYEKMLKIPARLAGQRIYLRLDGAASKSEVAIDGQTVGRHIGAYSSHTVDITPYVTPGETHLLTVTVDNSDRSIPPYSADFTFMGGLYRDVWLIGANPVHLDITSGPTEGVKVRPELMADGSGQLKVTGEAVNRSGSKRRVTVSGKLYGPEGKEIASKACRVDVATDGSRAFSLKFDRIPEVRSWSPESPELYTLVTEVIDGGKVADRSRTAVGFRTFGFDEEGRFLLNGKPYKLRGMCRHQDQRPMGIALTDEQHRRDMQLIKDMGANFIRISHYPQDDAVPEMCDRLGLIAWEEIPVIDYVPDDSDFAENSETMVREMIRRHYNHPSVAMWGYMNEILLRTPKEEQEVTRERTEALAQRLEEVVREEDATRLSTMAFHGSDVYHEAGLGEITDVKGWNLYQGWYGGELSDFEAFLSRQHREHPEHKLIVSEYGAGSDLRIHSLEPEPFDFSMEYQQKYLEHYLPVIEDSAFVAGASHWNFIDFSSANRAESMPHINNKGLVTNDRRKKDVYHYYKAAWTNPEQERVAHIASRDWAVRTEVAEVPAAQTEVSELLAAVAESYGDTGGKACVDTEGKGCVIRPIKVYTNLPAVELSVNGMRLPAERVRNNMAIFEVPLRDGKNVLEVFEATCDEVTSTNGKTDGQISKASEADGQIGKAPEADGQIGKASEADGQISKASEEVSAESKANIGGSEQRGVAGEVLDAMTVDMKIIGAHDGKLLLGEEELAVNVGSNCYYRSDESGLTWLPDREYEAGSLYGHVGGRRNVNQDEIGLTADTPLFQRNLTEIEAYRVNVAEGEYEVELGFADLSSPSALSAYMLGHNAGSGTPPTDMDIAINGKVVEEGFCPGNEVGVKNMVRRRYVTEVSGNDGIVIRFIPRNGSTSLTTLKVRKL